MATLYHPSAAASWQGNYRASSAGPNGEPTWVNFSLNITAAQAVQNNIFKMVKLDANTLVVGGYITTTGIDSNATATATVDVGFLSDANGDGDTDVVDWFVDGHACANSGARALTTFEAADGYFYPVDTLTSDGSANGGYFISCKLIAAIATAAAGNITLGLCLVNKDAVAGAAI